VSKKGARPERLSYFGEEEWRLMESCWAADPSQRPLLGLVEPRLENLKTYYERISQEYALSVGDDTSYMENDSSDHNSYLNVEYGPHSDSPTPSD